MEKDNYNLIERYLNGALNEEEANSFQIRLEEDPEFSEEYKLQKSMNIFLEKDRNQPALESNLKSIGKDYFVEEKNEKEGKVITINKNRWLIGLITTAAMATLLVIFNPFQQKDLYQQYAVHEPLSLTEKSESSGVEYKAEIAFNKKKDFSLAYKNLTIYLQDNSESLKAQLYLGICALEAGKREEAISIFEKISKGDSAFKNEGNWYLALLYLKSKDMEKVKFYLDQISVSETKLYRKAQKLSMDLE